MERHKIAGILVLIIAVVGIGVYAATRPTPVPAPTSPGAPVLPAGSYTEHGQYYDITASYATSTPLMGAADQSAVARMQKFIADTIAQFKSDGNFANLTAEDVKMMGFDQGRREKLDVVYLRGSSAHTVSYIFTIYMDTLGAHGNTTFKTFTFDMRTGALLSLADMFQSGAPYLTTLSEKSRAALATNMAPYADTKQIAAGTTLEEANFENFFLDNRDFVLLFPPYQVAAYAAGPQTVRIPLSQLSSILKPDYK